MKPTQTVVLLLIIVVMVFAVTFASMYVTQPPVDSPGKGGGEKKAPARQLVFVYTRYPEQDDGTPVVSEFGKKNHHDFWFENPHDEEVRVGLYSKNCTCSEVGLFVASPEWRERLAAAEASWKKVYPLEEGAEEAAAAFTRQYRQGLADNVSAGDLQQMLDSQSKGGVRVPARSAGFIRLGWEKRRELQPVETSLLRAELWMEDRTAGGPPAVLQVGALLVEPVRLDVGDEGLNVGVLRAGDAEERTFLCWSSTRSHFKLRLDTTGKPFVTCGPPEPLTEGERRRLAEQYRSPVLAGYRVPVTVRERVANKSAAGEVIKQIDQGPFVHVVRLTPHAGDETLAPLTVPVRGLVKGDVTVVGSEEGISLGSFDSEEGISPKPVKLRAERASLKLKLDSHPDFLTVKLTELPPDVFGRPHWELSVKVGPGAAPPGRFPRTDTPYYSDTAIYLKTDDAQGRRVRIPVSGTAILR